MCVSEQLELVFLHMLADLAIGAHCYKPPQPPKFIFLSKNVNLSVGFLSIIPLGLLSNPVFITLEIFLK